MNPQVMLGLLKEPEMESIPNDKATKTKPNRLHPKIANMVGILKQREMFQ